MICIIGMMGFLHHAAELGEANGAAPPADAVHGAAGAADTFGCCRDLWVPPLRPSTPRPHSPLGHVYLFPV